MIRRIQYWFLETFGQRDEIKTYQGYGNFSVERGWYLFGKWISYEKGPK